MDIDKQSAEAISSARTRFRFRVQRLVLLGLAWIFLASGIVGIFLPLLPGTFFLIIAAALFTRSSPRFEAWLLDHPRFGPPVRRWRARRAIPRRGKVLALASLVLSWWILYATGSPDFVLAVCLIVFTAVGLYVATRPMS
jgi:uncharacterized membrane protein YbaN (DUF454 family)